MESVPVATPPRYHRFLPYLAVLRTDLSQTLRSWIYRTWVLASILAAAGFLIYRMGLYREAGLVQHASAVVSDLLRWVVLGSIALVVVLAAGCISSERGTLADSVLSRGISRHQYFLAKWHARLVAVLGTFFLLGTVELGLCELFLHEDLSLIGCSVALAMVGCVLLIVVSWGVCVSALSGSTVFGIALLWTILYGGGFLLSLLPASYPVPDRLLKRLPYIVQGHYDLAMLTRLGITAAIASCVAAVIGLFGFSRRDV